MFINIPYITDICLWMSKFYHHQRFHGSRHWLNINQSANSWDPARICSMTSYGLSCIVLHLGWTHVTSHNKQHGGLHVVLGEWYKNAHNLIQKNQMCLEFFLYGLSMSSSPNLNIHLLWVFFSFNEYVLVNESWIWLFCFILLGINQC